MVVEEDLQIGDTFNDTAGVPFIFNGIKWQSNSGKPYRSKKPKMGELVHYVPFEGCNVERILNGRIKIVPDDYEGSVRVIFHCNEEWNNMVNYTSALTNVKQLRQGWITKSK